MKKIVKLFGLLLLTSSSLTFTACKDYDEDDFNELRTELENQNKTLTQLIESQKAACQSEIDALKKALNDIKSCTCDPADVDKKIEQALKDYVASHPYLSEEQIRSIIKQETALFVTAEQLEAAIAKLQGAVDKLNEKHDADIKDVLTKIAAANQAAADAAALAKTAKDLAQNALNLAQAASDKADANTARIEALETLVNSLQTSVATLEVTVQGLSTDVKKALQDAADAKAKAEANALEIQKLWIAVNALSGGTVDLSNYYTKEEVQALFGQYFTKDEVQALLNRYVTKDELTAEANRIYLLAQAYIDQLFQQLDVYTKGEVDVKVSALTSDITTLQGQMTTVQTDLGTVQTNVTNLQNDIDTINTKINNIFGLLNKLVSGIIVQGTTNNVFGSVRLPIGVDTKMLIAFYGKSINSGKFPTTSSVNYANLAISNVLTAKEAEMINLSGNVMESTAITSGSTLISKTAGNAGKLYVTVNPSNVDFSGMALNLETSQGNESGVELTPLAKSDEELKFGVTRAADNGFYETQATIKPSAITNNQVQRVDIDVQGFASIAKNLKNTVQGNESLDAGQIAEVLYNTIKGNLNAYGAKINVLDDATGVRRQVTSEYGVAAAVFTPLSYNFGYTFYGRENFWGYEYADKFIDKIGGKVNSLMQKMVNEVLGSIEMPEAPTIQRINLVRLDPNDPSIAHFEIQILNKVSVNGTMLEIKKDPADGKFYYYYPGTNNKYNNTPITTVTLGIPEQDIDVNLDINSTVQIPSLDGNVTIPGEGGAPDTTGSIKTDATTGSANGTAAGSVKIPAQDLITLPVSIDLRSELADFYNQMVDQVEGINGMIDGIQTYLEQVNGLLDNLHVNEKIETSVGEATSALHNVLNRINGKAVKFLNAAILKMQPVMFFTSVENGTTSIHYTTSTMNNPSVIKDGNITLVPISFTGEMLNPAYKKHVAVVNVVKGGKSAQNGDAECQNILKQVNAQENMNTVIDGGIQKIAVSLPKGYTYQIAYSAVDYTGVMSTVRSAIRVLQ